MMRRPERSHLPSCADQSFEVGSWSADGEDPALEKREVTCLSVLLDSSECSCPLRKGWGRASDVRESLEWKDLLLLETKLSGFLHLQTMGGVVSQATGRYTSAGTISA